VREFSVTTQKRSQLVDITELVRAALGELEGATAALVYVPHTTAGVTINEHADPDVARDVLSGLEKLAPQHAGWRHAEGNSDAHLKTVLVGSSATVPVSGGTLVLGTWQGIFLCEFDGPRDRWVDVTVVGA